MFCCTALATDTERIAIEGRREQLRSQLANDNAVCHQKFAVNSCLNEINVKHREAMADLRRQEILLNDDERRKRGAEQLRKVEEKSSPAGAQETMERRAKFLSQYEDRAGKASKLTTTTTEKNGVAGDQSLIENRQLKTANIEKQHSVGPVPDRQKAAQQSDVPNRVQEKRSKQGTVAAKKSVSTAKPLPIPP